MGDREVACGELPVEPVDVAMGLEAVAMRQRAGIEPRTGDEDHAQLRDASFRFRERGGDSLQQVDSDSGTAGRDDAHLLVGPVAELGAERIAIGDLSRVEAGDVAGELEALLGPVADRRETGAERPRDDVVGIADEDRPVAQARVARDVLDHLGVVVGGEESLALAAVGHRQHADEVGEPDVRRGLQLRVLVQEVVDLPGLVGDPDVERLLSDQVVEDHEVGAEDLVEAAQHLEGVELVLARFGIHARGLRGELRARRVDRLAAGLEQRGHGVLGEPMDLEPRGAAPELPRDRDVAPGVTEADRRRDEQCPPRASNGAHPGARPWLGRREAAGELVRSAG